MLPSRFHRQKYQGEERRVNPDRVGGRRKSDKIHPWRWRLLALWIICFTAATLFAIRDSREANATAKTLAVIRTAENRKLLQRIQDSRLESCVRTYTVIQSILDLSVHGRVLSDSAKDRLSTMRSLADPEACVVQTAIDQMP